MDVHEFSGTHAEVGRGHGEALRDAVRASAELRLERCERRAAAAGRVLSRDEIRRLAVPCLRLLAAFSPGLHDEVAGIAAGAGLPVENILITAGYTDFVDVVLRNALGESSAGCTAFYAGPLATGDGSTYVGQTWDLFPEAAPGVIGLRLKVAGEPEVFAISYAGCVGMMGMNADGVAVAGTNLRPTDARPGVPWVFLCRVILSTSRTSAAVAALERAPLCSGHSFLFADGTGAVECIETTGERQARLNIGTATFAHTNHYLDAGLQEFEAPPDGPGSSRERLARMSQLLRDGCGRIDRAFLEAALRDHDGRPRSICAHEWQPRPGTRVRTCAAVIMNTAQREVLAVQGYPCESDFRQVAFQPASAR